MSNTQASTQRVAIILSAPSDWDEWIEIVKTKAIAGKIWEYVNPATEKASLPVLEEPVFPKPSDVNWIFLLNFCLILIDFSFSRSLWGCVSE